MRTERQLGKYIKTLRPDRGGEYFLSKFKTYLLERDFILVSCTGIAQQNGVIERRNITLLEMVRSMMSYSNLPISF